MRKSQTLIDLYALKEPEDWKHDPIHAGSIYIKPTKDTECNCCGWFYYIFCCGFCYANF